MNLSQRSVFAGQWQGDISSHVRLSRRKPVIIAGPCMLESLALGHEVCAFLKEKCDRAKLPLVFKSSYDKANRTSMSSQRGPGILQGLQWLEEIRHHFSVPVVTDVHSPEEACAAGRIVDILQIPAFLCEQRSLLQAAISTGKIVQIKKGQWLSAKHMLEIARFLETHGHNKTILVERGTCFGYNNLVVDFRNLIDLQQNGHAVVFDATHAVQLPSAKTGVSSGLRHMVPSLVRAAVAVGVEGVFMEVHKNPAQALSDADTQLDFTMASHIIDDIAKCAEIFS